MIFSIYPSDLQKYVNHSPDASFCAWLCPYSLHHPPTCAWPSKPSSCRWYGTSIKAIAVPHLLISEVCYRIVRVEGLGRAHHDAVAKSAFFSRRPSVPRYHEVDRSLSDPSRLTGAYIPIPWRMASRLLGSSLVPWFSLECRPAWGTYLCFTTYPTVSP